MDNGFETSNGADRSVRQKGLTLVELLVAISVLGFVAILGWRGLDSIVRARIALTGELEQTRGMQIAFAQMQSDCVHLALASTLKNKPALSVGPGRLMLVRTVFAENQPSRLQVITYQLKDGVLSRRESPATRDLKTLDTLWLAAINDMDTAQPVKLQADVAAMVMRTWANGNWHAGIDTPAGSAANPPTGLEVTLQLRGRDTGMQKIFLLGAV